MKYCLVPNSERQRKLYDETVKPEDDRTFSTAGCRSFTESMKPRLALFHHLKLTQSLVLPQYLFPSPTLRRILRLASRICRQSLVPREISMHASTFRNKVRSAMP